MLYAFYRALKEKNYKKYLSENTGLLVLLLVLFIVQFYLTWNFSSTDLNTDYIGYFVEPFVAMENHSFFTTETQYRPWIGYPLFLVPVFEILGMTADMLRNISIFFTALSLPMGYLAFREWFNPTRALVVTLIPLTWTNWVEFRYNEMPIVLFVTFLTIYLFLRWFNTRKKIYLYGAAFLSGFGFYVKANQLYTVNGLIAGALTQYDKIKDILEPRILVYSCILFLVGVMPFLVYTVNVDFGYLNAQELYPDYDDHGDQTTTEVRAHQLKTLTQPELSILMGWGENDYHIFQLLFITGFLAILYSGNYFFAAGFLTVFLQFYYVPTDLNTSQIISMIPFYLFVVAGNLELLPDGRKIDITVLLLTLVVVAGSISNLEADDPIRGEEQSFTTNDFEKYQTLGINSSSVVTNSYNLWLISMIDLSTDSYLVHEGAELEDGFSYEAKMEDLYLPLKNASALEDTSLVLIDNCEHETCTVPEEKVLDQYNHPLVQEEIIINSFKYRFYSD